MSKITKSMIAKQEKANDRKEWIPPWYTGEKGEFWPEGKILKARPATDDETMEIINRFRKIGTPVFVEAANIMQAEIMKRNGDF